MTTPFQKSKQKLLEGFKKLEGRLYQKLDLANLLTVKGENIAGNMKGNDSQFELLLKMFEKEDLEEFAFDDDNFTQLDKVKFIIEKERFEKA